MTHLLLPISLLHQRDSFLEFGKKMSATASHPRHTHSCDFHDALSVRPAATGRATAPIASSSSGDTGGLANSDPEASGGAPADYILYGMDVYAFPLHVE